MKIKFFNSFKKILIFDTLLKLLILCSFGFYDLTMYPYLFQFIKEGNNPYMLGGYPNFHYTFYPALFFELQYAWYYLFGDSMMSLRLLLNLADYGCLFMMYLIGKQVKNKERGLDFALMYSIFPLKVFALLEGKNDFVAIFFQMVGIYFYLKENHYLSAFFLGLGFCYRVFPILTLIPILMNLLKKKNYKLISAYILIPFFTFILTSIRYLIEEPWIYISSLFRHFHRGGTGLSFTYLLPFLNYEFDLTIAGLNQSISLNVIIALVGGVCLMYLFYKKQERDTPETFFKQNLLVYLSLLILMFRIDLNTWYWCVPFLIPYLFSKKSIEIRSVYQIHFVFLYLLYIIFLAISVALNAQYFHYIYHPYMNTGDFHLTSFLFERYERGLRSFGIWYYLFLLITGSYFVFLSLKKEKDKRIRILGFLTLIHGFDASLYLFYERFLVPLGTLGSIIIALFFTLRIFLVLRIYQIIFQKLTIWINTERNKQLRAPN